MSKLQRRKLAIFLALFNLAFIFVAAVYATLVATASGEDIVSCPFKNILHLYCPGCGGSRSLVYLFKLDIISATMSYPPMPVLLLFYISLNMRAALAVSSSDFYYLKSFNLNRLIIIPAVIILCFIIRNVLLVFFGYDYLGDLKP